MGKLRPGGGWQSRVPSRLPKLTTFAPPTSSSLLRTEGGELDPFSQEADGAGRAGAMGAPSDLQLGGSAEVGTGAAATEDL